MLERRRVFSPRTGPTLDGRRRRLASLFVEADKEGPLIDVGIRLLGLPRCRSLAFGTWIWFSDEEFESSLDDIRLKLRSLRGCISWLECSSPSMTLPRLDPLGFDFRKLGSNLLALGRLPEVEGRVEVDAESFKEEILTLSSVFSSSSHSLSEPKADAGRASGECISAEEDVVSSVPGLAGVIASIGRGAGAGGAGLFPPSSSSPWPAWSLHCTLFRVPAFFSFFSFSISADGLLE